MRNQRTISAVAAVVIIVTTGLGLLISCGEKDTQTDNIDSDDIGGEPQAVVRESEEDTNRQQDQREETFKASLEGDNQVPEVETKATGNVTVTLQGDSIYVQGGFSGLRGEYVASHIHMGSEHENGDPVVPLDPELGEDKLSGSWDETHQVDEEFISALNSDSLYVNVHSEEHPQGEVRGQLFSANNNMNK